MLLLYLEKMFAVLLHLNTTTGKLMQEDNRVWASNSSDLKPSNKLITKKGHKHTPPICTSYKSSSGDEIPERDVTYHLLCLLIYH